MPGHKADIQFGKLTANACANGSKRCLSSTKPGTPATVNIPNPSGPYACIGKSLDLLFWGTVSKAASSNLLNLLCKSRLLPTRDLLVFC